MTVFFLQHLNKVNISDPKQIKRLSLNLNAAMVKLLNYDDRNHSFAKSFRLFEMEHYTYGKQLYFFTNQLVYTFHTQKMHYTL